MPVAISGACRPTGIRRTWTIRMCSSIRPWNCVLVSIVPYNGTLPHSNTCGSILWIFLPRDAFRARIMLWSCVCVSVRLSVYLFVRLSPEIYRKRRYISPRKQCRITAINSNIQSSKISVIFRVDKKWKYLGNGARWRRSWSRPLIGNDE